MHWSLLAVLIVSVCCINIDERAYTVLIKDSVIDVRTAQPLLTASNDLQQYVIKFAGVVPNIKLIKQLQVQYNLHLVFPIPYNAYIVALTGVQATQLSNTAGVLYVSHYDSKYKVSSSLLHNTRDADTMPRDITVMISRSFAYVSQVDVLEVENTASSVCPASVVVGHYENNKPRKLKVIFDSVCTDSDIANTVSALAEIESVEHVEPKAHFHIENFYSHGLVQSGIDPSVSTGAIPFFAKGINGTGQVIAVGDTGIDVHSCFFYDPDHNVTYYKNIHDEPVETYHRKIAGYMAFADDQDYVGGHGSHTSGTLAGMMSLDRKSHKFFEYHGAAPGARIAFFDAAIGEDFTLPDSLLDYFPITYKMGARIHSNSWGDAISLYSTEAEEVDEYMFYHPDFLVFYSAGNLGENGPYTINSPHMAKNVMTIGAAETSNPGWKFYEENKEIGQVYEAQRDRYCSVPAEVAGMSPKVCASLMFDSPCIEGVRALCADFTANGSLACCHNIGLSRWCCPVPNPDVYDTPNHWYEDNMAYFSSRGPVMGDNRHKPDVTCPGQHIWSAKSHGERSEVTKDMCGTDVHALESAILHMQGTSMATPNCAGHTVLLREYLVDGYIHDGNKNPSFGMETPAASLMKALLINGAQPMRGVVQEFAHANGPSNWTRFAGMDTPNDYFGYGRVNLANTVPHMDPSRTDFNVLIARDSKTTTTADDVVVLHTEMTQGQNSRAMCFKVNNAAYPVVMTMAYTDKPGMANYKYTLVDDLDMIIYKNGARVSAGFGIQTEDRVSNVEHARIEASKNDVFVVYVSAVKVMLYNTTDTATYSLVASGGIVATECPNTCEITCVHGSCVDGVCLCSNNTVGLACDQLPCPDCNEMGTCDYTTGQCICDSRRGGIDCSEVVICPDNCNGHGECLSTGCACEAGWFGDDCKSQVCSGTISRIDHAGVFSFTNPGHEYGRVKCVLAILSSSNAPNSYHNVTLYFASLKINANKQTYVIVTSIDRTTGKSITMDVFSTPKTPYITVSKFNYVTIDVNGYMGPEDNITVQYTPTNNPAIASVDHSYLGDINGHVITLWGFQMCSEADYCYSADNCSVSVNFGQVPSTVKALYCGPEQTHIELLVVPDRVIRGFVDITLQSTATGVNLGLPNAFEFIDRLFIDSVTPDRVPTNESVQLRVKHSPLRSDAKISRAAVRDCESVHFTKQSNDEVLLDVPSDCITHTGYVFVSVFAEYYGTAGRSDLVLAQQPATVASVVPMAGLVGRHNTVTITGTGFGVTDKVIMCDVIVEVVAADDTVVQIKTPISDISKSCDIVIYGQTTAWTTIRDGFYFVQPGEIDRVTPNITKRNEKKEISIYAAKQFCSDGDDVIEVTLAGVRAVIKHAEPNYILVEAQTTSYHGTGDVIVTSLIYGQTVKTAAFTYEDVPSKPASHWLAIVLWVLGIACVGTASAVVFVNINKRRKNKYEPLLGSESKTTYDATASINSEH